MPEQTRAQPALLRNIYSKFCFPYLCCQTCTWDKTKIPEVEDDSERSWGEEQHDVGHAPVVQQTGPGKAREPRALDRGAAKLQRRAAFGAQTARVKSVSCCDSNMTSKGNGAEGE